MNPKVSIVVLNYNGRRLLEQFLPSVVSSKYPNYEVILVDNDSKDNSVEFVKTNYPQIKIIQNAANIGIPAGYNAGTNEATGKYILWTANDIEFTPDVLSHLVERCESDDRIGICTTRMYKVNNRGEVDNMGATIDFLGFPSIRTRHAVDCNVFASCGGSLFIRKELVDEVGGLDSAYFTLNDDIDFSWRVRLAGYRVVVEPQARLYHLGDVTLDAMFNRAQKRYFSERNTLRTLLKNYSLGYLLFILPIYFVLLFMEMVFFLLMGKPRIAMSGIFAIRWNMKHFKGTLERRRIVQELRVIDDYEIWRIAQHIPKKIRMFFDFIFNHKNWRGYFK